MSFDDFVPFGERKGWEDVKPIPQQEIDNPVVPINYSDRYVNTMNYFRALYQKQEISKRALTLVTETISLNPANYTVWWYRRNIVFGLKSDLEKEILYLNDVIEDNEKNYQVWYHREKIMEKYFPTILSDDKKILKEKAFIQTMLNSDSKNYHCWSYRSWLVKTFKLYKKWKEFDFTSEMLKNDVRNNSVWNYRFFLHETMPDHTFDFEKRVEEMKFSIEMVKKAPNNESPWNYFRGLTKYKIKDEKLITKLTEEAEKIVKLYVKSIKGRNINHANWLLLECNEYLRAKNEDGMEERKKESINLCNLLIEKDKIRKNYWDYRLKLVLNK